MPTRRECVMRRWSLLALFALSVGCSDSGARTPSAPSPPATQPPAPVIQPADLTLVRSRPMEFLNFDAQTGWTFEAHGENVGQGCAATVKGTARFMDASGVTLQTIEFSLDPGKRVRPAETFLFRGCCLTEASGRAGGTVVISFSWENVTCQ
jgi:hypothetical protein